MANAPRIRNVVNKSTVPAVFLAALTSVSTLGLLAHLEGNILHVYPDKLAGGIPTYCAGKTDWKIPLGTTFTSDQCAEVNKTTLLEYGFSVLECTRWTNLTPNRLVALTMFAINVGKSAACGSQAVAHINQGQIQAGCRLIAYTPAGKPNWSYAGGVYVQGLHNRRLKEYKLCLS